MGRLDDTWRGYQKPQQKRRCLKCEKELEERKHERLFAQIHSTHMLVFAMCDECAPAECDELNVEIETQVEEGNVHSIDYFEWRETKPVADAKRVYTLDELLGESDATSDADSSSTKEIRRCPTN